MSYYATIYKSLAADVEAFYGALNIPVIYTGTGDGKTPDSGQWVEFKFFYNDTTNVTLANDGPSIVRAFARLGIAGRPGRGLVPLYDLGDQTVEHFKKGYSLDVATNTFIYVAPSVGGVLDDDEKIIVPVTLRFQGTYTPQ